jgi:predicted enzyme related to lactoylglutathione lyase
MVVVLNQAQVTANIPAADLDRARRFYSEKLGLTPASEYPGMLMYQTSDGSPFSVYETEHAGKAGHTIAQWHVNDVEAEVGVLQTNGVSFEVYDEMPGVQWNGVVASISGMGRAAWFKDSEGNIMCIDDGEPTG